MMHKLLQQMGRKVVQREEPWKLRILVNAQEICDVLERAKVSMSSCICYIFCSLN